MHRAYRDGPEISAFRAKMETLEAKGQYKKRGAVAEFLGLAKAKVEAQWVCLTYNIQQWIRLCWKVCRLAVA